MASSALGSRCCCRTGSAAACQRHCCIHIVCSEGHSEVASAPGCVSPTLVLGTGGHSSHGSDAAHGSWPHWPTHSLAGRLPNLVPAGSIWAHLQSQVSPLIPAASVSMQLLHLCLLDWIMAAVAKAQLGRQIAPSAASWQHLGAPAVTGAPSDSCSLCEPASVPLPAGETAKSTPEAAVARAQRGRQTAQPCAAWQHLGAHAVSGTPSLTCQFCEHAAAAFCLRR